MYLGRIVELTTSGQLYSNPLHPYTQALLSAVPTPDPDAVRERVILQGDVPSPANPPSGCTFHTRCPHVTDECRTKRPEFRDVGDGHFVACHLYKS
jgi:peptide/nickel transport system ATP-binding protein/oligopeptide transport system ATP-binding protein